MDSFNTTFEDDEYEEVPSPFRKSATRTKTTTRSTNLFARPMGTAPSEAPTIIEGATRRSPARMEQTEFLTPKRRPISAPQVDYLDDDEEEEEEEVQERRVVRAKPKQKTKAKVDLVPRIGWGIVAALMLRLVFMERGVIDYMTMDNKIKEKETELSRLKNENQEITTEIKRITLDKSYQKQLAKEHLGVIAADEFLILFAGESQENETSIDRPI
ncbi:MAG: septum formation initiator family protein [Bacteriovoracaceae bacterium]|nr:septum formation initiator family protein [Bacteriovoracaceae bacterium]